MSAEGAVVGGCCAAAIVVYVAEFAAVVWAILDLSSGNQHRTLDIVILVLGVISLLGGSAAKANSV